MEMEGLNSGQEAEGRVEKGGRQEYVLLNNGYKRNVEMKYCTNWSVCTCI